MNIRLHVVRGSEWTEADEPSLSPLFSLLVSVCVRVCVIEMRGVVVTRVDQLLIHYYFLY